MGLGCAIISQKLESMLCYADIYGGNMDFADRISITIKARDFFDFLSDDNDTEDTAPIYHLHIELGGGKPEQALQQIYTVIYSNEGRIPEPYTIEETRRTIESGASGTE